MGRSRGRHELELPLLDGQDLVPAGQELLLLAVLGPQSAERGLHPFLGLDEVWAGTSSALLGLGAICGTRAAARLVRIGTVSVPTMMSSDGVGQDAASIGGLTGA